MRSVSCFLAIVLAAVLLCACGAKDEPRASVESVVQENWPQFSDAEYDETAGTLRLTQESTMTYASAQKFGGEVYKDDLSLESYLDIVGVISYDVQCLRPAGADGHARGRQQRRTDNLHRQQRWNDHVLLAIKKEESV
ncbi:MAG: hypothetical protein ACLTCV_13070 [Oscillospiraceae bacterium]